MKKEIVWAKQTDLWSEIAIPKAPVEAKNLKIISPFQHFIQQNQRTLTQRKEFEPIDSVLIGLDVKFNPLEAM